MKADRNLPHVPVTWKSGASAPREASRNQRGLHGKSGSRISLTTDGDVRAQHVLIQLFMPPFVQ